MDFLVSKALHQQYDDGSVSRVAHPIIRSLPCHAEATTMMAFKHDSHHQESATVVQPLLRSANATMEFHTREKALGRQVKRKLCVLVATTGIEDGHLQAGVCEAHRSRHHQSCQSVSSSILEQSGHPIKSIIDRVGHSCWDVSIVLAQNSWVSHTDNR